MITLKKDFNKWASSARQPTLSEIDIVTRCFNNHYTVRRNKLHKAAQVCVITAFICLLLFNFRKLEAYILLAIGVASTLLLYMIVSHIIESYKHVQLSALGEFEIVDGIISHINYDQDDRETAWVYIKTPNEKHSIGPFQIKLYGTREGDSIVITKFREIRRVYFAFTQAMFDAETYLEEAEMIFPELEEDDVEEFAFFKRKKRKRRERMPMIEI